jgi:2'-5' RNA ligase
MRYRTFIAIDVSPFARDRLVGVQQQLSALADDVKWVEPDNLHLTLIFLGEVDERDVVDVCRAVTKSCADVAPFAFTLEGLGAFPTVRRPRTLIAKISEGHEAVRSLQKAIEPALLDLGCYRREERPFTPHVTIGRVKRDGSAEQLSVALLKFAAWSGGQTPVKEVLVLSSNLGPDGPKYSLLSRAKLGGA